MHYIAPSPSTTPKHIHKLKLTQILSLITSRTQRFIIVSRTHRREEQIMGLSAANGMILVLMSAALFGVSMANRGSGWNNGNPNANNTYTPRKIIVGGDSSWTFGFDYMNWSFQNGPYFVNDTLVFRFDPPSDNNTHPHSVYLFPNFWSFQRCDLKRAQMIANVTDGSGDGFEFVLSKWKPYYFGCGASNGFHCNNGKMKFYVWPMLRRWY